MNLRKLMSLVTLSLALGPLTAEAQLSRSSGPTRTLGGGDVGAAAIKGTDNGYDPLHDAYLAVGSCYGSGCSYGEVYGRFMDRSGTPLGGIFSIASGTNGHFPRVRYAAELDSGRGGFLVTWLQESGDKVSNRVLARVVTYPGVALGNPTVLNDGTSYAWIESAAAVGYSQVSQRFLVAWRTYPSVSSPAHVAARLVDITGTPLESVVTLSAGFGRDPGVTWNSTTNQFGVSFGAEASGSSGFAAFAVVPPVNAAAFTRNSMSPISGLVFITDVDFNPDTGNFVMIWHQNPVGTTEIRVAEINSSAQVVTEGLVVRGLPGYDADSIAFNPISRTFVVSTINGSDDVVTAELNRRGLRTSEVTTVGPDVTARYPRISSSTEQAQFKISFSNGFQSIVNLVVATSSVNGGPDGANGTSSGGTTSTGSTGGTTSGCTTTQPASDWVCVNGGWVPPSTTSGGTTSGGTTSGGCTTVKPVSDWVCVNGGWVPPTTTSGGTTSGGCTTTQPASDWVCVNGSWVPPSTTSGGTSSCTTPKPGENWVCVNGGWVPSSTSTGSCTTPKPGENWVCVNGGWVPSSTSTSSCTTPKPGDNWVCVKGDWNP